MYNNDSMMSVGHKYRQMTPTDDPERVNAENRGNYMC